MGRQYKNSGIDWIGFVPDSWAIAPTKRHFRYGKEKVGAKSDDYERLALTMSGAVNGTPGLFTISSAPSTFSSV